MALLTSPIKSVLISWIESKTTVPSLLSWEFWFEGGGVPDQFQFTSDSGFPTNLLRDYGDSVKYGLWHMRLKKICIELKEDVDFFFAISSNYVQHNTYTASKETSIVPQCLEILHFKGETDDKLSFALNSLFVIINNPSQYITIFLDNLDTNDVKKSSKKVFKKIHVLVEYQRVA
jgi:hypothetical protein